MGKCPDVGDFGLWQHVLLVFQKFRDVEDGCEHRLRLRFPAASPQSLLDEYARHLAIEFQSFVPTAFERQIESLLKISRANLPCHNP
jgi:hypothetical protein